MSVRIALAQINPTVGDIQGNLDIHRRVLSQAGQGMDIVIFPECSLPGYPAQDLLFESAFRTDLNQALEILASETGDQWVLVGTVRAIGSCPGVPIRKYFSIRHNHSLGTDRSDINSYSDILGLFPIHIRILPVRFCPSPEVSFFFSQFS